MSQLERLDVVQINPNSVGVGSELYGLFAVVTEIWPATVRVYIPTSDGLTYLSLLHDQFTKVGQVPWVAKEEDNPNEEYSTNSDVSTPSDNTK